VDGLPSSSDSLVPICGKLWVNCGKLEKYLWKNWGMCSGKPMFKIRIANFPVIRAIPNELSINPP
jgi:hypothetical protein